MRAVFGTLVRFFLTGIATILPFVVTVFVVTWIVKIADAYIGPSSTFGMLIVKIAGPSNRYPAYLTGYLVVVIVLILLGFLVNRATIARFHAALDKMFAAIPLFGKIYMAVGQVVDLFGAKDQTGLERFGGVGIITLGNAKMLALLTSSECYTLTNGEKFYLVFVPNSPIPATGFNLLVAEKDFSRLDMPVEDLAKLLMSLGLLGPQVLRNATKSLNPDGHDEQLKLLS